MLARKNHHATEKQVYVELEKFSFTFIDAEDYAASEKWQKIFICILIIALMFSVQCSCGAAIEHHTRTKIYRTPEITRSIPTCID
jgi:hypothetical protein